MNCGDRTGQKSVLNCAWWTVRGQAIQRRGRAVGKLEDSGKACERKQAVSWGLKGRELSLHTATKGPHVTIKKKKKILHAATKTWHRQINKRAHA